MDYLRKVSQWFDEKKEAQLGNVQGMVYALAGIVIVGVVVVLLVAQLRQTGMTITGNAGNSTPTNTTVDDIADSGSALVTTIFNFLPILVIGGLAAVLLYFFGPRLFGGGGQSR